MKFVFSILSLSMLFVNGIAFAGCATFTPQTSTASLGNYTIQRDTPVGAVIAEIQMPSTTTYASGCTGEETFGLAITNGKPLSSYGNHVYDTNLEGIGIRMHNGGTSSSTFDDPPDIVSNNGSSWPWNGGTLELIKTGAGKSGIIEAGQIGKITAMGVDDQYHDGVYVNITAGNIVSLACSLDTSSLNFPLGDLSASDFGDAPGFTSSQTNTQNLGLNCDADANINVMLTGSQHPDVTENNVLALSGQGDSGIAQGVGVQLLYDGSPLELNKNIVLKKSAGGQETFPITARYYQTKTTVMPGKADTSATLNLTYQ